MNSIYYSFLISTMFSFLPDSLVNESISYAIPLTYTTFDGCDIWKVRHDEILANPNAVAIIFGVHYSILHRMGHELSKNTHPAVIGYLLAHPELIDYESFCVHSDERAVDYILRMSHYFYSDERYWTYMAENPNDRIVDRFVHRKDPLTPHIYRGLARNPNERAINYLFQQQKTDYLCCSHPSDQVVSYFLSHPEQIRMRTFSSNSNDRAVDYLFEYWYKHGIVERHTDVLLQYVLVYWGELSTNSNDRVVSFLLQHKHCVNWYHMMKNTNPRVRHHVLTYFTNIKSVRMLSSYPYLMTSMEDTAYVQEMVQRLTVS